MTTDKILASREGPVGFLVFNNPERRNAVSLDMWQRAAEVVTGFAQDDGVRVIVLAGAGGKSFVSGADISKFEDERANAEAQEKYSKTSSGMRALLRGTGKPTIAMIRGYCIGGGMSLALSCDLRICSDDAQFGIPAARLGIGYGMEGLRRLVELAGPSAAKEFIYTARRYTAAEALRMGIVNQVLPAQSLDAAVRELANTIAANAPLSILTAKRVVDELMKDPAERNVALCEDLVRRCGASEDFIEGRRAFMEKRKPVFKGR
ncbi:MAG: enoyl-CoA hydratase/isomerase family protein [Burkholderiales bacterium]|nr:enoyl-CoA hydratase/isomerase family protein [Burkholderiales bacterium]